MRTTLHINIEIKYIIYWCVYSSMAEMAGLSKQEVYKNEHKKRQKQYKTMPNIVELTDMGRICPRQ